VYSNNQIYYLDSHYDRCLLEIHPSYVTEDMTWSVKGTGPIRMLRTSDG
jgi:hypothetical protein